MNQSSLKETFTALTGDMVVLKPFLQSDVTLEYVAWLNDPVVVKYSNQRFVHHTLASCTAYLAGFENTGNLFIKVEQKVDSLCVGTMTAYVSSAHQTADVGIMIGHRSAWGKGLGQDAWSTLLNWLLHQDSIRKITAGTMRCNAAMIKLMERSGMDLEAVRPKQELLDGVPQDLLYFGKFRDATA